MRHASLARSLMPIPVNDRAVRSKFLIRRQLLTRLAPLPLGKNVAGWNFYII